MQLLIGLLTIADVITDAREITNSNCPNIIALTQFYKGCRVFMESIVDLIVNTVDTLPFPLDQIPPTFGAALTPINLCIEVSNHLIPQSV